MPMSSAPMPMSSDMSDPGSLPTDYKILNNRYFDGTDLEQAKARGLSDNEIATIIKVSKETGLPFGQVSGMVERGTTFPQIATEYGLKLSDIYSVDKEKQDISDYMALSKYEASLGRSSDMSTMPMTPPSTMPMTPPATSMTPPMTPSSSSTTPNGPTLDIVETVMAAKNLTTLVKALQIAGLVDTLKGAGPFTVFAPDDRAFAKLPAGKLDALEADPAMLKQILTYHVIPVNIKAADAMSMTSPTSPPTVEGSTLQVTKGRKGRLKVNNATVIKADIGATNGTIHIINEVLMPPTTDTTTPSATTDTTTPPAASAPAPMDAAPPAAPATPQAAPDATTPPAAPATPNTTAPATPPAAPAAPATPGQ